jgi:signal peptidase I
MRAAVETRPAATSLRGVRTLGLRVAEALWVGILPAAIAFAAVRYLVPPAAAGIVGVVSAIGSRHGVLLGVALFLAFSAAARYWRSYVFPAHEVVDTTVPANGGARRTVGTLAAIALTAAAILAFRATVIMPYRVLSASMLPTLEADDVVAGFRLSHELFPHRVPKRGEIVVFPTSSADLVGRPGTLPTMLLKRVIGLPGDRIFMHGSTPVINGWEVPTCNAGRYKYVMPDASGEVVTGRIVVEFLGDATYLTIQPGVPIELPHEYLVREGEVFVLGDNRDNSLDSRSYHRGTGGGVPVQALLADARWFLLGTHRDDDSDYSRLLRPVSVLQTRMRWEGAVTEVLEPDVARCLEARPAVTTPPPPGAGAAATSDVAHPPL